MSVDGGNRNLDKKKNSIDIHFHLADDNMKYITTYSLVLKTSTYHLCLSFICTETFYLIWSGQHARFRYI
jgi:hypothetical protein